MWLVDEATEKAAGAVPPVIVSGLTVCGVGLQDWVYILTALYLILQIGKFLWNTISKWRSRHG